MSAAERNAHLRRAVADLAQRCPRLIQDCYWAGTSAIMLEELGHRESFDLDWLLTCLDEANLSEGRRRALRFMLEGRR